jgi:hypothetical protein
MREIVIGEFNFGFGWVIQEDGETLEFGWEKTYKAAQEAAKAASED